MLSFFLWNCSTIYWIGFVEYSKEAALGAPLVVNTLLYSAGWRIFLWLKKRTNGNIFWTLPAVWIPMELVHYHWDLDFPWLTLGNGFAGFPILVQWFEWTGVFGGSLWVIWMNVLVFNAVKSKLTNQSIKLQPFVIGLLAPIFLSLTLWFVHNPDEGVKVNATAVQPNIDPYSQKYDAEEFLRQFDLLKSLSLRDSSDLVVWPETSIPGTFRIDMSSEPVARINSFWNKPALLIAGASCYDESAGVQHYYNAMLGFSGGKRTDFYAKSKLVAGIEKIPFSNLSVVQNLLLDFGGATVGMTGQKERAVFSFNTLKVEPLVCYEQEYGAYVSEGVNKGANLIAIGTNDGWWQNSQGHKQHFAFAGLRAIENRRWVVRAANTGISGFINSRGEVVGKTLNWAEEGAITQSVCLKEDQTIYARLGDWIAYLSIALLMILTIFPWIFNAEKTNRN